MEKVIDIQHLSKSFGDHEVLKDINFSVAKGEVVCIIGSSGSGKSTLLRCINLLEKPSGGQIIYKGQNILDDGHDIYEYRTKMGMVFQQFNLFNNHNVLGNCIVGQMKVLKRSREEAEKVAMKYLKVVGMDQYVNAKPRQLSGGQKQRVAIARVFLKDPAILILDEATSALDLKSEQLVRDSLKRLAKNRTTIIVAHRLSTVTDADRIYYIDGGRVLEAGTHGELMAMDGLYARLFRIQHLEKEPVGREA